MSYTKVKNIKIDNEKKEVWIKGADSSITPLNFKWWKAEGLSDLFDEKGREAVVREILYHYYTGDLQGGYSNFNKVATIARAKYPWGTVGPNREISEEDFKEILFQRYNAYNKRSSKKIIAKSLERPGMYIKKVTKNYTYLCPSCHAKVFKNEDEAKWYLRNRDPKSYELEEKRC